MYTPFLVLIMAEQTTKYKFGQSEFDTDYYKHNLGTNLQRYIQSKGWNDDQVAEFKKYYDLYANNLDSGRFSTDDFGTITDTQGELNDDLGKIWIGGKDGKTYQS